MVISLPKRDLVALIFKVLVVMDTMNRVDDHRVVSPICHDHRDA
jgi:hypothetical protein